MRDECARKGKWIGGCRFEPRYNKGPVSAPGLKVESLRGDLAEFFDQFRPTTYVADVCTTCGKIVSRLDTTR
jgi:hypothetical protein